ncbi:unnamed protein product [Rotaria socialis]
MNEMTTMKATFISKERVNISRYTITQIVTKSLCTFLNMVAVSVVLIFCVISFAECYWKPTPLTNWTWQIMGTLDTSKNVVMYDIDLWDTPNNTITALKNAGKKVIYYFSAGSYEDWRQDKSRFPASVKGDPLDGWQVKYFLHLYFD